MQSILFLKSKEDGPIDRIINLDLLATAHALSSEEGQEGKEGTVLLIAGTRVQMGMPFPIFIGHVEKLIADNYKYSNEASVAWHNKKMADLEEVMRSAMSNVPHK